MLKALVIEDSLTDREILTQYLQQSNVSVVGVSSGEEALPFLQAREFDIIFLDVVLPGQSGFELCRDLKVNQKTRNLPVVICSTKDTKADQLWGSMLGADAYLCKPVNKQQLQEAIQKILSTEV
ncbi:MAG: response regulator [Cyanobacteria bacterium P01_H01_bin.119]